MEPPPYNSIGGNMVEDNVQYCGDDTKRFADFNECIIKILDRIGSESNLDVGTSEQNTSSLSLEHQSTALAPLYPSELNALSYFCTATMYEHQQQTIVASQPAGKRKKQVQPTKRRKQADLFYLENIEMETITTLLELLEKHVRAALSIQNFMENAMETIASSSSNERRSTNVGIELWLQPSGIGNRKLLLLRMGLEAATILLFFACCKVAVPDTEQQDEFDNAGSSNRNTIIEARPATCSDVTTSALVNEDTLESVIALFRLHLMKHLIPSYNQTGHLVIHKKQTQTESKMEEKKKSGARKRNSSSASRKRRKNSRNKPKGGLSDDGVEDDETGENYDDENDSLNIDVIATDIDEDNDQDKSSPSPVQTIKNSQNAKPNPAVLRDMKKFYSMLHDSTIQFHLMVMDRLQMLVRRVPLDDQQILLIASGAISSFEIDCYLASNIAGSITNPTLGVGSTAASKLIVSASEFSSFTKGFAQQVQISSIDLISSIFQKYANHRDVIMEDLFPMILKLPSYKRSLRSFPVQSASVPAFAQELNNQIQYNHLQLPVSHIQMMTALILSLVQRCAVKPTYEYETLTAESSNSNEKNVESPEQHDPTEDTDDNPKSASKQKKKATPRKKKVKGALRLVSGLRYSWNVTNTFIQQLLQRCSVGKGETASEFRPFLSNFVEDLLLILVLPQYPAAESLLLSMQRRFNFHIQQAANLANKNRTLCQQLETTYINLEFDLLAKINCTLARIIALQRMKPIAVKICAPIDAVDPSSNGIVLSDYCQGALSNNDFMLSCDSCQHFFPGNLVGIPDVDSVPNEWFCDSCRLGKMAIRERGKHGYILIDDPYVVNNAYMTTCLLSMKDDNSADAIRFYLARWIDELNRKRKQNLKKAQEEQDLVECNQIESSDEERMKKIVQSLLLHWDTNATLFSRHPEDGFTEEGNIRILLAQLMHSSLLLRSFRSEICFLVRIMSDDNTGGSNTGGSGNHGLRKMSLKTIERIVDGDPELMLSSIVTKAVSYRLTDESISVREAAVSLVGAYVVYSPAVAKAFHASLLTCLNDVGVSVRKRCIKIFQAILTSSIDSDQVYEGRAVVCDTLLRLAANPKEEDGVRDLIHELFFHLWIENATALVESPSLPEDSPTVPQGHVDVLEECKSETAVPLVHVQRGEDGPAAITPNDDENNSSDYNTNGARTTTKRDGNRSGRHRADCSAEQMVEVVQAAGTGDYLHSLLVDLLVEDVSLITTITAKTPETNGANSNTNNRGQQRRSISSSTSKPATISASKKRAKIRIVGQEQQQQCIKCLVDALFELLLSIEEQRSSNREEIFSSVKDGASIAATFRTIDVFAKLEPAAILKHIDVLLPYLKADNGVSMEDESLIVGAVCDILYHLASAKALLKNDNANYNLTLERVFKNSVADDLVQITYRFGSSTLHSAVRTLAYFTSMTRKSHFEIENFIFNDNNVFAETLMNLSRTFYSYLFKKNSIMDFSKTDFTIQSGVHRALTVLGLICQYHEDSLSAEVWENEVDSTSGRSAADTLFKPKSIEWTNLNVACFRLFSQYLDKLDADTKCKAMEAFGGLFLAQPRLVLQLEKVGLISEVMSEKAVFSLQMEALDCWKKILISEEQRIDGGEADAKMESDGTITVSKKISGDQDGDATLFGGVLTNHAQRLFQMTESDSPELRLSALQLLGLLLRQGLVNPNEAVPHLFALQGDIENVPIRSLALRLLMTEGEKRPDILRQRICAGVKQAYKLQRSIYSEKMEVSAITTIKRSGRHQSEVECIFSSVYKECIASNKKQRQGLFRNLLSLFEVDDSAATDAIKSNNGQIRLMDGAKRQKIQPLDPSITDVALLSFVAQVLAHLPYNVVTDPLFIVHHISSIVTLQSPQVVDLFASFLRPYGLASEDDLDETNEEEDALERAAASKFPSRMHEAKPVNSKEFNWETFTNLCRKGATLCLLLRLKEFLCSTYNLSFTRCMEYDPNAKDRLCDKGIPRVCMNKPFDAKFPSVFLNESCSTSTKKFSKSHVKNEGACTVLDKDSLIRQYGEFRRRIREENNIDRGDDDRMEEDVVVPMEQKTKKTKKNGNEAIANVIHSDTDGARGREAAWI